MVQTTACSDYVVAGGMQVSAAVPAISINSLSAPLSTATVMAPVSTSIPIGQLNFCLWQDFFFSPTHLEITAIDGMLKSKN